MRSLWTLFAAPTRPAIIPMSTGTAEGSDVASNGTFQVIANDLLSLSCIRVILSQRGTKNLGGFLCMLDVGGAQDAPQSEALCGDSERYKRYVMRRRMAFARGCVR